jgi:hypothetical protein
MARAHITFIPAADAHPPGIIIIKRIGVFLVWFGSITPANEDPRIEERSSGSFTIGKRWPATDLLNIYWSMTRLEDHVERRFRSATDLTEATCLDYLSQFRLSCLGAERHTYLLR